MFSPSHSAMPGADAWVRVTFPSKCFASAPHTKWILLL